jgi:hypothetical protein
MCSSDPVFIWTAHCNEYLRWQLIVVVGSMRDLTVIQGCRSSMSNKRPDGDEFTQNEIEGKYANYFEIGHNAFEFVLDFGQKYADGLEGKIHTRIVTGPSYAKELLRVLEKSIAQYEQSFGLIEREE